MATKKRTFMCVRCKKIVTMRSNKRRHCYGCKPKAKPFVEGGGMKLGPMQIVAAFRAVGM